MTSHKPPQEAFNFGRQGTENHIQRDWGQFERRLDYIIEFKGKWNDEIEKCTTQLIFHKGSESDF